MSTIAVDIVANAASLRAQLALAQADVRTYGAEVRKTADELRSAGEAAKGGLLGQLQQSAGQLGAAQSAAARYRNEIRGLTESHEGLQVASAGVTREIIVLGHEMLQGNFTRIPGSIMVLGERIGGITTQMVGFTAAIGLAVFATYELARRWLEVEAAIRSTQGVQLSNLTLTSQSEAETRGWITELKERWRLSTEEATKAAEAIRGVGGAGAASQKPILDLAVGLATLKGQDVAKTVEEWAKSANSGADSFIRFAEGAHMLDADQTKLAQDAAKGGDQLKAFGIVIEALTKNFADQPAKIQDAKNALAEYNAIAGALSAGGAPAGTAEVFGVKRPADEAVKPQPAHTVDPAIEQETVAVNKLNEAQRKRAEIYTEIGVVQKAQDAGVAGSAAAQAEAWVKLSEVHSGAEQRTHQAILEHLQEQMVKARDNTGLRVQLAGQIAAEQARFYGADTSQARQASVAVVQAQQSAADKTLAIKLSSLSDQENAARAAILRGGGDISAVVAIEQQKLAAIAAVHGKASLEYVNEEKHMNELVLEDGLRRAKQQELIERSRVDTDVRIGRLGIEAERQNLNISLQGHQITAQQKLAILTRMLQEEYAANVDAIHKEMANNDDQVVAKAREADQLRLLQAKLNADLATMNHQAAVDAQIAAAQSARGWRTAFGEISSASSGMISSLLRGQSSFRDAAIEAGAQLLEHELANDANFLLAHLFFSNAELAADKTIATGGILAHLAMEQQKTAASVAGAEIRSATAVEEAAAGREASATAGSASIMNDAYKAAAGAYASAADIPFVGWLIAPVAAAAAFTAVAAYDVLTAEQGAWNLPADSLVQAHAKESILPAAVATPMREFFTNGADKAGGQQQSLGHTTFNGPLVQVAGTNATPDEIIHAVVTGLRNFHPAFKSLRTGR